MVIQAVRGATYDLLEPGRWDGFGQQPPEAYSTLTAMQRLEIQERVRGLLL